MTVIELTLTLSLLLSLSAVILFSVKGIFNWKLARFAGEEIRAVYIAQKNYLADHHAVIVSELEESELLPYLPGGREAIPEVESLDGDFLIIDFRVIPPVVMNGASVYDPSGKSSDSLWDAGVR